MCAKSGYLATYPNKSTAACIFHIQPGLFLSHFTLVKKVVQVLSKVPCKTSSNFCPRFWGHTGFNTIYFIALS